MGLRTKATKGGGEKPEIEAGSHQAVCIAVIDMGTQEQRYQDNAPKQVHQLYLAFEIPGVAGPGAGCLVLGRALNLSLHEKSTLRKWVEAWRGKKLADDEEVDFEKLLKANCLLSVAMNKNDYPVIDGVSALVKGMSKHMPTRTPFYWDLEMHKDGKDIPIPDWVPYHFGTPLAEVIEACDELSGTAPRPSANGTGQTDEPDNDDEAPF